MMIIILLIAHKTGCWSEKRSTMKNSGGWRLNTLTTIERVLSIKMQQRPTMQHYICRKLNVQTTNFGKTLQSIEILFHWT